MTRLPALNAYHLWAGSWDRGPSPIVSLEHRTVEPWLVGLNGRTVIDVSCGTGRWLEWLAEQGTQGFGFDFSRAMLRVAQSKPAIRNRLAVADLRALPVRAGQSDAVVCSLTLGHLSDPVRGFRLLGRLLRPGGMLVVSDFHPEAARQGWKRTFKHGDATYEVENHPYPLASLRTAADEAGLSLVHWAEPRFGEPELAIFATASKESQFGPACQIPAVWAGCWQRPQSG